MPMEQFDSHDEPSEHTGIPIGRFMPLTPSRSYLGGGLLLGQLVLGRTPGSPTAGTGAPRNHYSK
ncbi:hypothetical protein [Nocardia sp. NPDC052112]|uniref:hypothetical protein n=1 Tax=Nocardia sp. NPDC052112 TaxID=3155646 RepID=UPI003449B28A